MPSFDPEWLARVEEAGLNASAPPEQRWIDGWLVRLAHGKARRARCIQPVAPGRLGIDDKLARCLPLYDAAGLRPFVRITPFAQPAGLDEHLDRRGMEAIDETLVLVLPTFADAANTRPAESANGVSLEAASTADFVDWVAAARGSTAIERDGHARRLVHAPIAHHAFVLRDGTGSIVAGGQVAMDAPLAGLYDIFTLPAARRKGYAERLCRLLLRHAERYGATAAYLQVEATNATAIGVYRRLGFEDGYRYHYRTPRSGAAG